MNIKKIFIFLLTLFFIACSTNEGVTPLMKASMNGNITQVKQFINKKSINATSSYGWTALMFASWKGHEDIVNLLLDKGANPNVLSGEIPAKFETTGNMPPTTALGTAIKHKHISIAKILIENGALIDRDSIAQVGATGDISLVKLMISKGANIDVSGSTSYYPSALCMASREGKLEMVKFLINNGANPNKIHHIRHNALKEAVVKSQLDVVRYLLKNKANPNIKLGNETVLYLAIATYIHEEDYDNNYEIIKLLLLYGADRFFKPFNGNETIVDKAKTKYHSFTQSPSRNNKKVSQRLLNNVRLLESTVAN